MFATPGENAISRGPPNSVKGQVIWKQRAKSRPGRHRSGRGNFFPTSAGSFLLFFLVVAFLFRVLLSIALFIFLLGLVSSGFFLH